MKQLFLLLCLATLSQQAFAQMNQVVDWKVGVNVTEDNTYELVLTGTIQKGWYVYSQYLESDDGPIKTSIEWEANEGISREGKTEESGTKISGHDEMFDMNITKFKHQLILTQRVKGQAGQMVQGTIVYMTCNDEQCLPPTEVPFEVVLPEE